MLHHLPMAMPTTTNAIAPMTAPTAMPMTADGGNPDATGATVGVSVSAEDETAVKESLSEAVFVTVTAREGDGAIVVVVAAKVSAGI